nr:unnamed protein product [Digitaria exilis]
MSLVEGQGLAGTRGAVGDAWGMDIAGDAMGAAADDGGAAAADDGDVAAAAAGDDGGGKRKLEIDGDSIDWHVKCLYYYDLRTHGDPSNAKSSRRMEWHMREHGMTHQDSGWQHPLVLCEVYKKETPLQWRQRRNHN